MENNNNNNPYNKEFLLYEPGKDREGLPSRGQYFKDGTSNWMKEKAELDGQNSKNLWVVHNKIYDFSDFMKSHPGGEHWLSLTKGQDITEAFETHHINENLVNQILPKYYKEDVKNPIQRFLWKEDGFYKTLKKRVFNAIGKDMKAAPHMILVSITVFLVWLSSFIFACYNRSFLAVTLSGALIYPIVGVGHNYIHQRPHILRYLLDFSMNTHRDWYVFHCISHHMFPNIELDFEISGNEPFLYTYNNKSRHSWVIYITSQIFYICMIPVGFIKRVIAVLRGKQKFYPENSIVLLQLLALFLTSPSFDFKESFLLWTWMHSFYGYFNAMIGFNNHRSDYVWSSGDKPIMDYGEHIIATTTDHNVGLWQLPSFLMFGGFNDHTVHHFFPTLDNSRYRQVRKIVEQTIKDFNIYYRMFTWCELVGGAFRVFTRERPNKKALEKVD